MEPLTLVTGGQEDDNCPVCQLMRKAKSEHREPSGEELMKAMDEANRMQNKQSV